MIELEVTRIDEEVEYTTNDGSKAKLWPIMLKDEEGRTAKIKLFEPQIAKYKDKIKIGSKLIITKGWCSRIYENMPEISTGKYGQLDIV